MVKNNGRGPMTKAAMVAAFVVALCLSALSAYLIWGWITIADVRAFCEQKGLDVNEILSTLARGGETTIKEENNGVSVTMDDRANDGPVHRFKVRGQYVEIFRDKAGTPHAKVIEISYIGPFVLLSENVVNIFFCIGVGYMVGMLAIANSLVRRKGLTPGFVLFRPLAGALASALIFLLVLSGGKAIWHQVAGANGLALGVIAVIGSIYHDQLIAKLRKWLRLRDEAVAKKEDDEANTLAVS